MRAWIVGRRRRFPTRGWLRKEYAVISGDY